MLTYPEFEAKRQLRAKKPAPVRQVFILVTGVRFPYGLQNFNKNIYLKENGKS
jgi:hypothetical protein